VKKIIGLFLIALLPAAFMAGCGSSTPTSNSAPTPTPVPAQVGPAALNVGVASSFAVLANSSITNDSENICGSLGIAPGTSSPPPAAVFACGGVSHLDDATAIAAASAIFALNTGAYNVGLAMTSPTLIASALGGVSGQSLAPGFYSPTGGSGTFSLSGTLTLNNTGGNPNNVYIFSTGTTGTPGTTIMAAANTQIVLVNVQAANVFWIAGTSITLGSSAAFAGNLMAGTTIQFLASSTLEGHAYSDTAITFGASNIITNP
jgi:hypothetical protein